MDSVARLPGQHGALDGLSGLVAKDGLSHGRSSCPAEQTPNGPSVRILADESNAHVLSTANVSLSQLSFRGTTREDWKHSVLTSLAS